MPTVQKTGTSDNTAGSPVPKEFFTVQTFRSLGGSVVASGVVATVISGLFHLDPKIVGFVVCLCVAYVGLFLVKKRKPSDYVVTFFNGFLIYFTLVGATSFYPYLNDKTGAQTVAATTGTNGTVSPFRPWVPDKNLVTANRELVLVHGEQTATLNTVQSNVVALETQIRTSSIPPAAKSELSAGLSLNKNLIMATRTNVTPRVRTLERMGFH